MSHYDSALSSRAMDQARRARTGRIAAPLFALAAYLAAHAVALVYFGFLAGIGPWPHVSDSRAAGIAPAGALAIDLALILLFGLQHSVMARPTFKRAWTRVCPPAVERSVYVLATTLALLAIVLGWQPIAGDVWAISATWARAVLHAGLAAGVVIVFVASMQIDGLALGGLRQAFEHAGWLARRPDSDLVMRGLYRVVRHPIQSGFLLTLWSTPDMTVGRLLLALAMSVYIAIGVHFEERNLIATFGDAYRAYARTTGGVVPRLFRSRGAR